MHPVAIQIGPLTIHWYGVLVALGFLVGLWNAARRAPRAGLPGEAVADLGPWLILGAVVGARLWYVASYWREQFAAAPWWEVFMVHHGGLVFYGGLVGATLAAWLFLVRRRLPLWRMADVLAPGIALGYAIGRLGCLMNGCCYGRACSLPWAVTYPEDNPLSPPTFPVHPTQIYDSLLSLALYGGLARVFDKRRFDGQVFALYLIGYAVTRSFVECFRGDYPAEHIRLGLTPAQQFSVWILLAGVGLLCWRARAARKTSGTAAS
ncbi:prolipoprotein diacylglyceryl transferase [Limisphaera sp. VF-2]|uniref:prolipoprotein diacylglyceryl transferase n=1 Tax=Limisphaera sp. VF-2 TaxID=3400418 RepID=UPI00176CF6B5|nr:prolipoprotein diacylglyceryl transferase [Limisphaera sp.]